MKILKRIIITLIICSLAVSSYVPGVLAASGEVDFLDIDTIVEGEKNVNISWTNNIATKGKVMFGTNKDNLNAYIEDSGSASRYHEIELANLQPNTTYWYKISAYSDSENVYSYLRSFTTMEEIDDVAPRVTRFEVADIMGTVAIVQWDTNEESSSIVEYGTVSLLGEEHYRGRASANGYVTNHVVIIKNLAPGETYYFKAQSVDRDGNMSRYSRKEATTLNSDKVDKADFKISRLRPNSDTDSSINSEGFEVSFSTSHYASGKISVKGSNFGAISKEVSYNDRHSVVFDELSASSEYRVYGYMIDIFGRRVNLDFNVKTNDVVIQTQTTNTQSNDDYLHSATSGLWTDGYYQNGNNSTVSNSSTYVPVCSMSNYLDAEGFYGEYFNFSKTTPGVNDWTSGKKGYETGWYDREYFVRSQIDKSLLFEGSFLPIEEKIYPRDPFYFGVRWRAVFEVSDNILFDYYVAGDNSIWVYIDGELASDLHEKKYNVNDKKQIRLNKGYHSIEIYFADRGPGFSAFTFSDTNGITYHPWPYGCPYPGESVIEDDNNNDDDVVVKGIEYSPYTQASALLKTKKSPAVYAILNGKRHYITSPASFEEYGYSWADVQTVSEVELNKYPRVRLIKTPYEDTVNYLYQRPEDKWLKIDLNSPTVFVSYEGNYWGDIVVINDYDMGSYPDINLIKKYDSDEIYHLEKGIKKPVSPEVFLAHGFNPYEVTSLSDAHFDSYLIDFPLK